MSKEQKFTEPELKQLDEIQKEYATLQIKFGQLGFAKLRVENEVNNINESEQSIKKEFQVVQEKEEKFINGITEKYGEGFLDPKTGLFNTSKK